MVGEGGMAVMDIISNLKITRNSSKNTMETAAKEVAMELRPL